jgi:hypothetical protein
MAGIIAVVVRANARAKPDVVRVRSLNMNGILGWVMASR